MIRLGQKVRDKISGFEGIAIGRTEFLNGCLRIGVQPRIDKDGKLPDDAWFDEPQLEIVEDDEIPNADDSRGGPMPSTPTRNKCK